MQITWLPLGIIISGYVPDDGGTLALAEIVVFSLILLGNGLLLLYFAAGRQKVAGAYRRSWWLLWGKNALSPSDSEELARLRRAEVRFSAYEKEQERRNGLEQTAPCLWATNTGAGDDGRIRILFRNTSSKEARNISIKWFRVEEDYYCNTVPQELAFVANSRDEIQFRPIGATLRDTKVSDGGGTHILIVYFEDTEHQQYRQEFEVETYENGLTTFKSRGVKLQ